jgi:hypothetical protein
MNSTHPLISFKRSAPRDIRSRNSKPLGCLQLRIRPGRNSAGPSSCPYSPECLANTARIETLEGVAGDGEDL